MHDLGRDSDNSVHGSIYIVHPKMHGSDKVAFTDDILTRVEEFLGLPQHTVKIGVMDEERRVNGGVKSGRMAAHK